MLGPLCRGAGGGCRARQLRPAYHAGMDVPDAVRGRRRRPGGGNAGQLAAELLRINAARALDQLSAVVAAACGDAPALVGLSGGLDSAVLAAVVAGALDAGRVRLVYLRDRTSAPALRERARTVAVWLGVPLEEVSIDADLAALGVYTTPVARLTACSGAVNRRLYRLYGAVTGETPFVTTLRVGQSAETAAPERSKGPAARREGIGDHGAPCIAPARETSGPWYRRLVLEAEAGFVARHRRRRMVLEEMAGQGGHSKWGGYRLLGAANRTEWLTGWFVKGGIDDFPGQPLRGLYKTQVRQLAVALDVPGHVLIAAPSPDMMKGLTDEIALGMSYPVVDLALDMLAGGLGAGGVGAGGLVAGAVGAAGVAAGVGPRELRRVQAMTELSRWKRRPAPLSSASVEPVLPEYPVDGGPSSGLRS